MLLLFLSKVRWTKLHNLLIFEAVHDIDKTSPYVLGLLILVVPILVSI